MLGGKGGLVAALAALCAVGTLTATVFGGVGRGADAPHADAAAPRPMTPAPEVAQAELPQPPGTTERMSAGSDGRQGDARSGGVTDLLASANADQAISADGRWVAFASTATNLIQGVPQPAGGVYLRDRQSGETTALPWLDAGPFPPGIVAAEPTLSNDGGVVAFTAIVTPAAATRSFAARTATPYVLAWDRQTNLTEVISVGADTRPTPGFQPSVSGDGRHVAYTAWALPTAPPTVSGLRTTGFPSDGQFFVFGPSAPCTPHEATFSVIATDPDDAVTGVTLSYQPNGSGVLRAEMTRAGGDTWRVTIVAQDAWGVGPIPYSVQARDAAGNVSSTLRNAGDFILNKGECFL